MMAAEHAQAAPAVSPVKGPWRTHEVAILKQHYALHDGVRLCQQALPHRTSAAIYRKAREAGLAASNRGTLGKRFARRWHPSEEIDTLIREGYAHASQRGDIGRIAAKIGRPPWWVQVRAAELGVNKGLLRIKPWTAPEIEILEQMASARPLTIAAKLRAAGFDRTATAVVVQLKRRSIDTHDPDTWQARDLAQLMGVADSTVRKWCNNNGLKHKQPSGPTGHLYITRRNLIAWLKAGNGMRVDLRKVDRHFFLELAFGGAA